MTLPLAIVGPALWVGWRAAEPILNAGNKGTTLAAERLTGYNFERNAINWGALKDTYGPLVVGGIVHYIAKATGINKTLGRAKVPLIRI